MCACSFICIEKQARLNAIGINDGRGKKTKAFIPFPEQLENEMRNLRVLRKNNMQNM